MEEIRWDDEVVELDEVLDVDEEDLLEVELVPTPPVLEVDKVDWVDQHVVVPLDDDYPR
jgi:hypothetical protein